MAAKIDAVFRSAGMDVVVLGPEDSRPGRSKRLKKQNAAGIVPVEERADDSVVVTLPNFGDERAMPTRCGGRISVCRC